MRWRSMPARSAASSASPCVRYDRAKTQPGSGPVPLRERASALVDLGRYAESERDVLLIIDPLGLQLPPRPAPRIRVPPPVDDPPRPRQT